MNRQFLFQKQHINQSKAKVARDAASAMNRDVSIIAHQANIKSPEFDVSYYASFDVVLSALDNLETRRWVNRMCVMARVPLIESGTAGFLGQVQPIRPSFTECYDCTEHPMPTTYPVCTIRSTPSTPVHCIVWAKNWLFPQLFGEVDQSDEHELTEAAKRGEDAVELQRLRNEARQLLVLRDELVASLRASSGSLHESDAPHAVCQRIFNKLYQVDIERLLAMDEMWQNRTRPKPLTYSDARHAMHTVPSDDHTLRDRRHLTVAENAALFTETTIALARRSLSSDVPISFDKDDDEALGFVTAASNLRAHVYHIPEQTRFDTKQIAGNIIPAIATTNAIVAGLVVVQALHMLSARWAELRVVGLARRSTRLFTTFACGQPNPRCGVCQDVYCRAGIDPEQTTLQHAIDAARKHLGYDADAEISLAAGTRILYDADLDENTHKLLRDLNVHVGDALSVMDDSGAWPTVQFVLEKAETHGHKNGLFVLRTPVKLSKRVRIEEPPPAVSGNSDHAPDPGANKDEDDVCVVEAPSEPAPDTASKQARAKRSRDTTKDNEDHPSKRARRPTEPPTTDVIVLD